ncbi:MAG: alpha/beta hydrolase [Acidimicrobiia bacterium]|nr:alpha/beta hydrolase [Acidimicrobiia bacterium]
MFEGFDRRRIATGDAELAVVTAGAGPPVLLVHGYPQNHVMWHKVAPALAERFTVVAPDLRGYGDSSAPPAGERSVAYSKRVMATDLVALMDALGHERFAVVGHDRGARVSYRLALDHPDRVTRLTVLDIIPTLEQFESTSGTAGRFLWHWFFLAQPAPLPEHMILADREFFLTSMLRAWSGSPEAIGDEALAAYLDAFDEHTVRATCDDYRAGATIDCELDAADREAGRRITCPVLALWGDRGASRDLLVVWRRWADDVDGRGLPCGHFIAEEAPAELLRELVPFLEG